MRRWGMLDHIITQLNGSEEMTLKLIHWLALLPFIATLGFLPMVNTVTPYVLGLPFLLFWIVLWVILSSVIMGIIYKIDPASKGGE